MVERNDSIELNCSTLLRSLERFVRRHYCDRDCSFSVSRQLISIDEELNRTWQKCSEIDDKTIVFLYLLVSHAILDYIDPRTVVCVCLYVTYTYVGTETSYPLRAFIRNCNCTRERFFGCCLSVVQQCSSLMIRLNADRCYYDKLRRDLMHYL